MRLSIHGCKAGAERSEAHVRFDFHNIDLVQICENPGPTMLRTDTQGLSYVSQISTKTNMSVSPIKFWIF